MSIKKPWISGFSGKRVPALEDPEEDVSVDLTATMNMSEDAMKHYGSMLALMWLKSGMFTLSILRESLNKCCHKC